MLFKEHADLPADLEDGGHRLAKARRKPKQQMVRAIDGTAERKAALAFEKEERRRERERRKEETAQEKERQQRRRAVDKAQAALEQAEREHDERAAAIQAERDAIDRKSQVEDERWEKLRKALLREK